MIRLSVLLCVLRHAKNAMHNRLFFYHNQFTRALQSVPPRVMGPLLGRQPGNWEVSNRLDYGSRPHNPTRALRQAQPTEWKEQSLK